MKHPYLPADGGQSRQHRIEQVRPALVGTPFFLIDGLKWSVYSGAPDTHYGSGALPAASVGGYMPSGAYFSASLENGNVKGIMEFRKPSDNSVIGVAASNIEALVMTFGPRVYIGDGATYRALDCTVRLKMISESFTGTALTWNNAPAADASPAFTMTLNGVSGNHIGLVQSQTHLHLLGANLDQTKTYYGLELTVDSSFVDNGVPTNFIEPMGWWGQFYGILRGPP